MTIDFDKIRRKRQEEKQRQTRTFDKIRYWKPKTGENQIRLMPPWTTEGTNANAFWREVHRHWNVGNGGYDEEGGFSYTCPVKTPDGPGGTCEVCDFVKELRDAGTPSELEIAKKLAARRSVYSNVVDLKDPVFTKEDVAEWKESRAESDEPPFNVGDTKVFVWTYGSGIFNELLDYYSEEIDISSLQNGHDVVLTKEVLDPKNAIFTKYRTRLKPKSTVFNFVGDVSRLVYNLDQVSPFPEAGTMRKALTGESANSQPVLGASTPPGLPSRIMDDGEDTMDAIKRLEAEMRAATQS
jgi:hypothetical protein